MRFLPLLASVLLLSPPALAEADLWGGSGGGPRDAHATRQDRLQAVESADRAAQRPETTTVRGFDRRSPRRGSFVVVEGTASPFAGAHGRHGLHQRVIDTSRSRHHGPARFRTHHETVVLPGPRRIGLRERAEIVVRGNTRGLTLSAPVGGTHRFDRRGAFQAEAFVQPRRSGFHRQRGPFLRHRTPSRHRGSGHDRQSSGLRLSFGSDCR